MGVRCHRNETLALTPVPLLARSLSLGSAISTATRFVGPLREREAH